MNLQEMLDALADLRSSGEHRSVLTREIRWLEQDLVAGEALLRFLRDLDRIVADDEPVVAPGLEPDPVPCPPRLPERPAGDAPAEPEPEAAAPGPEPEPEPDVDADAGAEEPVAPAAPVTTAGPTRVTFHRGSDTTNIPGPGEQSPPRRRKPGPAGRHPGGINGAIFEHLPGRVSEIRDRLHSGYGYSPHAAEVALRKLVAAGRVRKVGPRPSTYHATGSPNLPPEDSPADAPAGAAGNGHTKTRNPAITVGKPNPASPGAPAGGGSKGPVESNGHPGALTVEEVILEILPASLPRITGHVHRRLGKGDAAAVQRMMDRGLIVATGQPGAQIYRTPEDAAKGKTS